MIAIKNGPELDLMRRSGEVLRDCFLEIEGMLRPGLTTAELDRVAEEFIRARDAVPAFKGYQGFPASICTSVNEQVVHGIPGDRVIEEGEIVSVDVGSIFEGFYGDSARTYAIGEISDESAKLMEWTEKSLKAGIDKARKGNKLGQISAAVQEVAESQGYGVVRQLVGHGIGREMHEEPQVPNYGSPETGPLLTDSRVGEPVRPIDMKRVREIARSMAEIGLMSPLIVDWHTNRHSHECGTQQCDLIAGRHRYEAAKLLGWRRIAAITRSNETPEQCKLS